MARRPSSWPERASTRSSGVIWAGSGAAALFIVSCKTLYERLRRDAISAFSAGDALSYDTFELFAERLAASLYLERLSSAYGGVPVVCSSTVYGVGTERVRIFNKFGGAVRGSGGRRISNHRRAGFFGLLSCSKVFQ